MCKIFKIIIISAYIVILSLAVLRNSILTSFGSLADTQILSTNFPRNLLLEMFMLWPNLCLYSITEKISALVLQLALNPGSLADPGGTCPLPRSSFQRSLKWSRVPWKVDDALLLPTPHPPPCYASISAPVTEFGAHLKGFCAPRLGPDGVSIWLCPPSSILDPPVPRSLKVKSSLKYFNRVGKQKNIWQLQYTYVDCTFSNAFKQLKMTFVGSFWVWLSIALSMEKTGFSK